MQAFGNDYVYIDAVHQKLDRLPELARLVSDRHFGVGSDGMVLICPSERCDFRMRMFNPDGSEAEMCGNALRSTAKYIYDHGFTDKTAFTIETLGGDQQLWLEVRDGVAVNITADIGEPRFGCGDIPVLFDGERFADQPVRVLDREFRLTSLSWGNPHTAAFVEDMTGFDVERYGRAIECLPIFPRKTNVTFVQVLDRENLKIREWERNCGETIGCATGCCTALVAAALLGYTERRVTVHQIGGPLLAHWREDTGHMFMTGESHTVFEAELDVPFLSEVGDV